MSAISIFLRNDTAHVLTDGAGYTPDARLVSTQQKVFPLAPLNLVLAIRGSTWVWPAIAAFVNELHTSFDDVVERFPETYRLCQSRQPAEARAEWDKPHEVYLVGVSEARKAAEAYCFVNSDMYGLPVGEVIELAEGVVLPADLPFLETLREMGLDPQGATFDPVRDGLRLIEAQRAQAWPIGIDGPPVKAVGGFAQLTTVRPDGITSGVLRRWPDRIGEKIGEAA